MESEGTDFIQWYDKKQESLKKAYPLVLENETKYKV